MKCDECFSHELECINTYKSYWYQCKSCSNIKREKKEKYLLEDFATFIVNKFPSYLNKIPKIRGIPSFFNPFISKPIEKDFYDYYLMDESIDLNTTKWADEFERFCAYTLPKINLNEIKLLDISGEPGFFAYKAKQNDRFKEVAVTAYSENVANRIKNKFGLTSFKYDFQKDKLNNITNEKYNLITIRSAINFCLKIDEFLNDLEKCLDEKSYVYVSFSEPSLGVALRWQYDDYTYLKLYTKETIEKYFNEHGFKLLDKCFDGDAYHYNDGIRFPFTLLRSFARIINSKGNLYQQGLIMLFQKI